MPLRQSGFVLKVAVWVGKADREAPSAVVDQLRVIVQACQVYLNGREVEASPVLPRFIRIFLARASWAIPDLCHMSGPIAVSPPSTTNASPVTNRESSLARKSAAPAISSPTP